jgi:Mce-associated membrane protein
MSDALAAGPAAPTSRLPVVLAAVLLGVLVAVAVVLGIRDHRHHASTSSLAATEPAAMAAARQEAVALTTIGYKTAASDLDRVLAGATGQLRTQFSKERSQLPTTLAQTKSVSRGTVLSSALSSIDGDKAQVLVAADAQVSGTDTGSTGVLKHYRMVMTLQRLDGRWLVSDVAFAGTPQ